MNTHISPAIIMRSWHFGETDLLVSFFTLDKGRLKGVAKGARRSRRRFPNCLDLFCLASLEYDPKKKGDLHFLHSCRLINAFPGLRSGFSSLSLASYMIEFTEILFPQGVVDKRMFELLKKLFLAIDGNRRIDSIRMFFEAKAMTLGGYAINLDKCCNCGRPYTGEGRAIFRQSKGGISCLRCERESSVSPGMEPDSVNALKTIQSAPLSRLLALSLDGEVAREIRPVLKLHIEYRIGRKLRTAEYLE